MIQICVYVFVALALVRQICVAVYVMRGKGGLK
jgi:hypothetical protein